MAGLSLAGERWARRTVLGVAYVGVVFALLVANLELGVLGREPRERMIDLVHGEAHVPFQLRVLVPWTADALAKVLPAPSASAASVLGEWLDRAGGGALGLAVILLLAASLTGFLLCVRSLLAHETALTEEARHLATWLAGLGLVPFFPWSHVYDLPTLALSAGMVLSARRDRPLAFVVLFVLAAFNRETALLSLACLWVEPRPRGPVVRLSVGLGIVFVLIQAAIRATYRDNPGTAFELHFRENTVLALHEPFLSFAMFVAATAIGWRVRAAWPHLHGSLRGQVATVLPLALAHTVVGVWGELRVFLEAYPSVFVAIAASSFPRRTSSAAGNGLCPGTTS